MTASQITTEEILVIFRVEDDLKIKTVQSQDEAFGYFVECLDEVGVSAEDITDWPALLKHQKECDDFYSVETRCRTESGKWSSW